MYQHVSCDQFLYQMMLRNTVLPDSISYNYKLNIFDWKNIDLFLLNKAVSVVFFPATLLFLFWHLCWPLKSFYFFFFTLGILIWLELASEARDEVQSSQAMQSSLMLSSVGCSPILMIQSSSPVVFNARYFKRCCGRTKKIQLVRGQGLHVNFQKLKHWGEH